MSHAINILRYDRPALRARRVVSNDINHAFRQVFDQCFDTDTLNAGFNTSHLKAAAPSANQWQPRVDIHEDATRFVISADLPGIDPRDIEIQMDKGLLSIKGERKPASGDAGMTEGHTAAGSTSVVTDDAGDSASEEGLAADTGRSRGFYVHVERRHGRFHRQFVLPDSVDADGISAHGSHGVLEVVIPKKPRTTPRRIVVGAGTIDAQ